MPLHIPSTLHTFSVLDSLLHCHTRYHACSDTTVAPTVNTYSTRSQHHQHAAQTPPHIVRASDLSYICLCGLLVRSRYLVYTSRILVVDLLTVESTHSADLDACAVCCDCTGKASASIFTRVSDACLFVRSSIFLVPQSNTNVIHVSLARELSNHFHDPLSLLLP